MRFATLRAFHAGLFGDPFANSLNLFNPDYSSPLMRTPDSEGGGSSRSKEIGYYFQDHVSIGERLTVTIAGRWDSTETDGQKDDAFSPTVGATWALTQEAALYANVAESFTPTPSWQMAFDGSLLQPETGKNLEAGIKLASKSGVLSGMLSVFQLTRQNVATDDPAHFGFYVVTGEQRSRGVEIEGAWRPSTAWDVRAAYSYIDAEVTQDNTLPVGIPLANAPKNSLNLWSKYTVQTGPLAKLGMSLGMLYNSNRYFYEFSDGQVYTLKDYTLLDAGLFYDLGSWTAQLNFNNLLDERHFPDGAGLDRITPGEPRNWQLNLSKSFF